MTGQQLFHKFVSAYLCTYGTPYWDNLSPTQQKNWNHLAKELSAPVDSITQGVRELVGFVRMINFNTPIGIIERVENLAEKCNKL